MKKFIVALFFLFLSAFAFSGYRYLEKETFQNTASSSNVPKQFEIKEGEGSKVVAQKLQDAQLIKNKYFFYYYVWKTNSGNKMQVGIYEMSSNMTIGQMMSKFTNGEIVPQIIKLTIPEGFTNKKIVARLREKKPELADEFEKMVSCQCINQTDCPCDVFSKEFIFLQQLPKGVDMEGYLFPDTYFIEKDDTAEILVRKFLNNFNKKINSELANEINSQGKTLYQIVTMASLIEKEAKTDQDRKLVSGVFWKRISDEIPLQSCATLAYITGIDKDQYSLDDTQLDSPYNTYLHPGLPVGPVANPGLATLTAAIYPQESEYYFFLTDPQTKEMIYSKTGEQHNENKVKHGL